MTPPTMRFRRTARHSFFAFMNLAAVVVQSPAAHASDADIVLKPAGAMNLQGLAVSLFALASGLLYLYPTKPIR